MVSSFIKAPAQITPLYKTIRGCLRQHQNRGSNICLLGVSSMTSVLNCYSVRSNCIPAFTSRHTQRFSCLYPKSVQRFYSSTSDNPEPTDRPSLQIEPGCTVSNALQFSTNLLKEYYSISEPEESVLHLLSSAMDLSWETGYREMRHVMEMTPSTSDSKTQSHISPIQQLAHQPLTSEQCVTYNSMLRRRLEHEPIQYIIGKWDFHQLSGLIIKKPMLCPRPETEELVELVLSDVQRLIDERRLDNDNRRRIRVLDVGAGTGAIGIAIANQYPNDVQVVALDISDEAVQLSNQNADKFLSPLLENDENNEVSELYQAILCSAEDFTNCNITHGQAQQYPMGFDIVVSNPPYIPLVDMENLSNDVLQYESHNALCGGTDGLDIIKVIIQRLPEWMSGSKYNEVESLHRYCWMEVDSSHPRLMEKLLAPGSGESIRTGVVWGECHKDFCGRDRFIMLRVLKTY